MAKTNKYRVTLRELVDMQKRTLDALETALNIIRAQQFQPFAQPLPYTPPIAPTLPSWPFSGPICGGLTAPPTPNIVAFNAATEKFRAVAAGLTEGD